MAKTDQCPFGPVPHTAARRHEHDYTPEGTAPRQCTCGSRHWKITVFPVLPPSVTCQRCARENRIATAYERGRAKGKRVRPDDPASPPF